MLPRLLAPLLLVSLSPIAGAQLPILLLPGDSAGDKSGTSIANAGDANADGRDDLIIGAPDDDNNGANSGSARLYSGVGVPLFTFDGDAAGDRFGVSVSGAGDVDRDGFDDVIVGSEAGYARIFSGADGSTLRTLSDAALPNLGRSVRGAGDVDADGYDDVIVGAPTNGVVAGAVRVYSGVDGSTLYTFAGEGIENTLDRAGDVNDDGFDDVILGESLHTSSLLFQGKAEVRSGIDGTVLWTFEGGLALDQLGVTVAPAGDVDGDGFDDVIAVSTSAGVHVFSGQTGAALHTFIGDTAGDNFGRSARGIGDVDGDGNSDILVGAPSSFIFGTYARLFSGSSGAVLRSFDGFLPLDGFGTSVGGADVDGDGLIEPMIGAPGHTVLGVTSGCTTAFDVDTLDDYAVHATVNGATGDAAGTSVAGAGDVNNDSVGDYIVGSPLDDTIGADAGKAVVYSGTDGSVIYTLTGDAAGDQFGFAVAGAGDVDNDGFDDVIVGAPFDDNNGADSGMARVYSGQTGLVLYTLDGDAAGDQLGFAVAGAGDVDNDNFDDVVAGAPFDDNNGADSGMVRVFSGQTGLALYTFDGDAAGDQLGFAVAGADDVDNDGYADIVAGAPFDDNNGADSGMARVFSGQLGTVLYTLDGDSAGDRFGSAVAGPGDLDGDDRAEILVGAPFDDDAAADAGRARVHKGIDGTTLFDIDGTVADDRLGASVARLGDANRDTVADLLIGAPQDPLGLVAGKVLVLSGVDASVLAQVTAPSAGTSFGHSVGGVLDTNSDDFADFIVGVPLDDPEGRTDAGAAILYTSEARTEVGKVQRFGEGCPGADGRMPRIGIEGRPLVGGTFDVTLYAAPGSVPAALHFDVAAQDIDLGLIGFPGCSLLALPFLSVAVTTDANGRFELAIPIPPGRTSMIGVSLYAQWITADIPQSLLPVSNGANITFGRL